MTHGVSRSRDGDIQWPEAHQRETRLKVQKRGGKREGSKKNGVNVGMTVRKKEWHAREKGVEDFDPNTQLVPNRTRVFNSGLSLRSEGCHAIPL